MTPPERSPVLGRFGAFLRLILLPAERAAPARTEWSGEERTHRRQEKWYWRLSLLLSGLIILGAGLSALFAEWTYAETKRQADLAQRNLLATTRAWLDIQDVQDLLGVQWRRANPFSAADTLRLSVGVRTENVGNSPALDMALSVRFWAVSPGPPSNADEHLSSIHLCTTGDDPEVGIGTAFMKSVYARTAVADVSLPDVSMVGERMPFDHGDPFRFVVCARYRVIGEEGTHLSIKAFELARRDADGGEPTFGDAASSLVLRRLPFGQYAD